MILSRLKKILLIQCDGSAVLRPSVLCLVITFFLSTALTVIAVAQTSRSRRLPDEHKSFNIIELQNGQFAAYPNNRCRLIDPSLSPEELKTPDFLSLHPIL